MLHEIINTSTPISFYKWALHVSTFFLSFPHTTTLFTLLALTPSLATVVPPWSHCASPDFASVLALILLGP